MTEKKVSANERCAFSDLREERKSLVCRLFQFRRKGSVHSPLRQRLVARVFAPLIDSHTLH